MQIYKGIDILTSKPAPHLRRKAAHHLIDIVSPAREYNVSRYRLDALRKIREIFDRGKAPLFVGGTGLYASVLIDGIFKGKSQDNSVRKRLYRQAQKLGRGYLYKRLKKIDPEAAGKIHPNDLKRVIRALEVFETTSKPISLLQKQRRGLGERYEVIVFCLNMEREMLKKRIAMRVEKMFAKGALSEAQKLLKLKLSRTAAYAIGLRELKGYLDGGYDLETAKGMIKRNTYLYAKRQLTWFRKDNRIRWVEINDQNKPHEVARRLWKEFY